MAAKLKHDVVREILSENANLKLHEINHQLRDRGLKDLTTYQLKAYNLKHLIK